MYWKISLVFFLATIVLFSCNRNPSSPSIKKVDEYYSTDCLIEAEELLLGTAKFKLIDLRKPAEFNTGHIPQALNVWRNQITDTTFAYDGMMPSQKQLEALLSQLGISTTDTLVIYDDKAGCDAARLWWLLKFYGHKNVKLLNGGLTAWKNIRGTLNTESTDPPKSEYVFNSVRDSSIYATVSEIEMLQLDNTSILLDTRGEQEYSGAFQKNGAAASGHIDGSVNIDWAKAVDYNGNKTFLAAHELRKIYSTEGIDGNKPVVIYCHTGVRSAHTLFVLTELLGYKNVKNYDGSWTEWSHLKVK